MFLFELHNFLDKGSFGLFAAEQHVWITYKNCKLDVIFSNSFEAKTDYLDAIEDILQ